MLVAMLLLFSLTSQYVAYSIGGNNITDVMKLSQESEQEAFEDAYVAAGRRQARWLYNQQTPFWAKVNKKFIDTVSKTSMKYPFIPFVVNVMCDPCINRMGKWSCCFFISWSCCTGKTLEQQD